MTPPPIEVPPRERAGIKERIRGGPSTDYPKVLREADLHSCPPGSTIDTIKAGATTLWIQGGHVKTTMAFINPLGCPPELNASQMSAARLIIEATRPGQFAVRHLPVDPEEIS